MSELYMRGTMSPKAGRKSKQYEKGRVCETDGCEQVLSIYNDNVKCFKHTPKKQPRIRGRVHPKDL